MESMIVRRDPLLLIPTCVDYEKRRVGRSRVKIFESIPESLRKGPLMAHSGFYNLKFLADEESLFVRDKTAFESPPEVPDIQEHIKAVWAEPPIPALWSGYRSCLVKAEDGQIYKLKGISFMRNMKSKRGKVRWGVKMLGENDDDLEIEGGQFTCDALKEKEFSDRFNKVLENEGIEPVMKYVGLYHQNTVKNPYSKREDGVGTSIIKVKGDTRLDELFYALEVVYDRHIKSSGNRKGFLEKVGYLYNEIGLQAGLLKKLMDKSKQSWSDNHERTNAHIGNVVVYQADKCNLKVGLVDFDAAKNLETDGDFYASFLRSIALRKQQKKEYGSFLNSAMTGGISMREIGKNFDVERNIPKKLRERFMAGFVDGYGMNSGFNYVNMGIPGAILREILAMLPAAPISTHDSSSDYSPGTMRYGLEDILHKNYGFNDYINGKNDYFNSKSYGINTGIEKKIGNYLLSDYLDGKNDDSLGKYTYSPSIR